MLRIHLPFAIYHLPFTSHLSFTNENLFNAKLLKIDNSTDKGELYGEPKLAFLKKTKPTRCETENCKLIIRATGGRD